MLQMVPRLTCVTCTGLWERTLTTRAAQQGSNVPGEMGSKHVSANHLDRRFGTVCVGGVRLGGMLQGTHLLRVGEKVGKEVCKRASGLSVLVAALLELNIFVRKMLS